MSDHEVHNLIFQAGFSTAETITDVSGRGVGMDVVKRSVENLRGKVEVLSTKGKGTSVLMKLPLTLAIIDGVMVRAGDRNFIIPTFSVLESLRPNKSDCKTVSNRGEMIKIRDSLHPLVRLHELFDFEPQNRNPWEGIVVIAESDGEQKCILVDELLGKQEVVIKSLGSHLTNAKGMAGGAILADGRVGLILDMPGLFELSEN
jgi:two-component system chemotaxis sensor kinase CheA